MAHDHPAQLLVCHERIAGDKHVHEIRNGRAEQFCRLAAYAWCFDCGFYVCEIHMVANHDQHHTRVEVEP